MTDMDMDMDIDGYLHGRREFCVPKRLKNNFISVLTRQTFIYIDEKMVSRFLKVRAIF
jgi:hypothetical protein